MSSGPRCVARLYEVYPSCCASCTVFARPRKLCNRQVINLTISAIAARLSFTIDIGIGFHYRLKSHKSSHMLHSLTIVEYSRYRFQPSGRRALCNKRKNKTNTSSISCPKRWSTAVRDHGGSRVARSMPSAWR